MKMTQRHSGRIQHTCKHFGKGLPRRCDGFAGDENMPTRLSIIRLLGTGTISWGLLTGWLLLWAGGAGCWAGENPWQDRDLPAIQLASVFRQKATVQDGQLNEISGMVPSSDGEGVWVLNDSGGRDELYRLDAKGQLLQTVEIKGAKQRDWEDLGWTIRDGVFYLVIGDTGNNQLKHQSLTFFVVPEPSLSEGKSTRSRVQAKIEITFPDGTHDCEAFACCDRQVYLATKVAASEGNDAVSRFYRFDLPLKGEHRITVEALSECPLPLTTAMDVSEDGMVLAIRDYLTIALYTRTSLRDWSDVLKEKPTARFPGPFQRQAEAMCFAKNFQKLWTISEGSNPAWWSADLKRNKDEQ